MTAIAKPLSPTEAVQRAAVEITNDAGEHAGVGLALELPGRGAVILTCHHVVAPIAAGSVRVRFHDGSTHEATLDAGATRVERDAAVLTIADPPAIQNPRLHAPRPDDFNGPCDGTAYSPGGGTGNFFVTLTASDHDRELKVSYEPHRYVLPDVFLIRTDDSRPGVSGSPVVCESGVVGLVHAARDERRDAARVAFVGPIRAWQDGLPELEELVEPFVTQAFRDQADVFWATVAPTRPELHVPGRPAPYIERPEDEAARRAFLGGALYLVGRHNSGKSRLICQLLRDNPEAIVVLPARDAPPQSLAKESDLRNRPVILVFDNVHVAASAWRPLQWFDRFQKANPRTTLVLTTWNEEDWGRVQQKQEDLFQAVKSDPVYLSKNEGRDLDDEEGWRLALQVGMDRATFERQFDGTPGSLLVDEDAPPALGEALPGGETAGTAITTVAAAHVPTNLPEVSSTFVGRERDLGALKVMFDSMSLVSVTGPAGSGKTRLAIRFGETQAASFPDGVWYVDLSHTRDERQVLDILAQSVRAGRRLAEEALVEQLRGRRALVILNGPDNVHAAASRFAAKLTEGNGPLRVLATVEVPLDVAAQNVLALEPLSTTDAAERLFLDRSGLTHDDRTRMKPFYDELGGNPAALEIAAAQVRATGLQRASDVRERRPTAGAVDVLRLAVMSSLEDIPDAEAVVFMRLGAMPDWFTLKAARAVAAGGQVAEADVPHHLRALVDRALLLIDARDEVAQRFRMLASVQDIALEQLEASRELDAVRRRHAAYFTHLAEEADRRLQGSSSRKWLARLEADQQHLRAALRWGIDNDRSVALRLSSRLWMACIARSNFAEGRRWIDEVAGAVLPALEDLPPDDVRCLADALIGGAYLAYHQADYADAERRLRDARRVHELPGAGTWHGDDENLRGLIARRRCEFRKARRLIRSSVDISRTEGDMPSLADRLNTLGNVIREGGGDLHLADRRQQQSLAIHARLGDVRGGAMVQCDRAYIRLDREDYAKARRLLEESLEARIAVRDKQGEAQSLNGLGILEREEGRPEAAIDRHEQALEIFERIGDMLRVAETREALGLALILAGRAAEGREYLDQGEQVRDRLGAPRPPVLRTAVERTLAGTRTRRFQPDRVSGEPAVAP